jgi:hydroxymethylpyrimidine/phosphomethylpyrimidine kinase
MLATASTVSLVAELLKKHNITKSVVDPVRLLYYADMLNS